MKNKPDNLLVHKAIKGDVKAFAELYKDVYKELFYYALSNLGNSDDAADCVEDTVLDAFSGIKKLRDEEAFKGWLFKILGTKIKIKQKEYVAARDKEDIDKCEISSYNNGFEGVEITQALSALSDIERQCVTLKYIAGYKGEEIAKLTGVEHSTVRSHIARAKQKLRAFLDED